MIRLIAILNLLRPASVCLCGGGGELLEQPPRLSCQRFPLRGRGSFPASVRIASPTQERKGLLLKTHTDPVSGNQVAIYDVGFSNQYRRVICGVFKPEHVHKFAPAIYDACPNTDWDKNIVWKDGTSSM